MLDNIIIIASLTLYCVATCMLVYETRNIQSNEFKDIKIVIISISAVLLHLAATIQMNNYFQSINISVSAMSISISALIALLFLFENFFYPVKRLGLIVFPAIIITLVFALIWNSDSKPIANPNPTFIAHMTVSIISYSLLTLAVLQTILFAIQENLIKHKSNNRLLMALAPLETMETLLFRLVFIGFFFLTLTLISGIFFSHAVFGKAFVFKHHVVLTVLGWLAFAILLTGRLRNGWRGKQAVIWTVAGFILISLGYFGTKMVFEVIK